MSNQYPPQYPTPDQPQQPIYPSGQMYPPPPPPPMYPPQSAGYAPGSSPYPTAAGYVQVGVLPTPANNTLAVVSLVCGILALCTGLTAIPAVICGHMALGQIKRSGGVMRGHGMAVAGLVLGYLEISLIAIYIIFAIVSSATGTGVPAQ